MSKHSFCIITRYDYTAKIVVLKDILFLRKYVFTSCVIYLKNELLYSVQKKYNSDSYMCDAGGTSHLQQGTFSPCVCLHVNYHELFRCILYVWRTRAGGTPQQKKAQHLTL